MAARKRRKSSKKTKRSPMAGKCKIVTVCGKRRKLCWGRNGKLKSNKKA